MFFKKAMVFVYPIFISSVCCLGVNNLFYEHSHGYKQKVWRKVGFLKSKHKQNILAWMLEYKKDCFATWKNSFGAVYNSLKIHSTMTYLYTTQLSIFRMLLNKSMKHPHPNCFRDIICLSHCYLSTPDNPFFPNFLSTLIQFSCCYPKCFFRSTQMGK